MKTLLYGFKSYGNFLTNVSEKIVKQVAKNHPEVASLVFPVKFNQQLFINAIKKHQLDIIIGTGQHPRARKIRIERKAFSKSRKSSILSSLKLNTGHSSYLSYDAGKYVCNYSMYVVGAWAKKNDIPYAFVHFPKDIEIDEGVKFLEKQLWQF